MINRVVHSEILDIAQYEKARDGFRRRIIALKKNRRLPVGPRVTFVFENHDTILFQIQEMMRAERLVDDGAIQHEIDTYNQLLPGENELSATMLIELPDPARVRDEITKFHGVNTGEVTYIQIGDDRLPGVFDAGQSDERRVSAVQYARFRFNDSQREALAARSVPARLVIDHPNYQHGASIEGAVRDELVKDFL
ncbi:MAG: DUF3501 family protein [Chloracidobacterium sp.]|nr:DUF3501 family protein [Chloracidobacterium sp.]